MFLSRANNDQCDGDWFKDLEAVRANETAQGNMTSPDTAELMKDRVPKSVSCQRAPACARSHPLMPLTEAEIACHLWSPAASVLVPSTIIPTIVFHSFLKKKTLFYSLLAFEFSSAGTFHSLLNNGKV